MHCPSCGQQQVSAEIKFCSRCGFPLGLVSEILANGGFLPQLADLHKSKPKITKKHGVVFSVLWFIFFTLIMAIFWNIVDVERLAQVSVVIGIFGGLMWMIASLVMLKSSKEFYSANQPTQLYGATAYQALPPQQSIPISNYSPPKPHSWRETNDLVQKGSVTDETTKILQNLEKR